MFINRENPLNVFFIFFRKFNLTFPRMTPTVEKVKHCQARHVCVGTNCFERSIPLREHGIERNITTVNFEFENAINICGLSV